MNIIDIINNKKENKELTKEEIKYFIEGYTNSIIPDYQISSLLMAIRLNGMSKEETIYLTKAMIDTGIVLEYKNINKKIVDKHSTGGVGDKTSLVLIPLLATLGFAVSKMSGRGLGHTGGTIDKLESFEGFNVEKTQKEILKQVSEIGCVLIGQTTDIVPADKKLYALRDVTATIDSVPLIASSIMSKKLALGSDIILLDVKYGAGAFMKTLKEARNLAQTMINIGNGLGKQTIACLTSMEQPLGKNIGNSLEVKEAIDTLQNKGNNELKELCISLAAEFLKIERNMTTTDANTLVESKLANGEAYQKFNELLQKQGVSKENVKKLPHAKQKIEIKLDESGYIKEIVANKIGESAMLLGAGRKTKEENIDLAVGFELLKKVGDKINIDDVVAIIHYNDQQKLKDCLKLFKSSFIIVEQKCPKPNLIEEIIK